MNKRGSKSRRISSPYFTDRRPKTKSTTLLATSKGTGLRHSFKNIEGWDQYSRDRYLAKLQKEEEELFQVLPFYDFIENFKEDLSSNLKSFKKDVFRFTNPDYAPTTIVGSISEGGRFNIGGPQVRAEFSTLDKAGCLYTASSAECALAEAVQPHGKHKLFQLSPKKNLQLWDLNSTIEMLKYPNLIDLVRASPVEALWVLKKTPSIPQILASKLRRIGGDGIMFESTKLSGHSNIAFFFKTDDESATAFNVQLVAT